MEKNKELIKSNQGFTKSVIATVIFGAILSMGLNLVWAWSNPDSVAPGGNIAAPLNTGNSLQTKSGPLTINGTLIAGSSMVLGGVSRNSWPTDNLGNHAATQNLNMNNFSITNANGISANSLTLGGITKASWPNAAGDNLGNHIATQNLNMGNFSITNANGISAGSLTLGGITQVSWPSGGGSIMYLKAGEHGTWPLPASCPSGWTEADLTSVFEGDGTYTNKIRTCYREDKNCKTMYLRAGEHGTWPLPASCPSGWTEADLKSVFEGGSTYTNKTRTCFKC